VPETAQFEQLGVGTQPDEEVLAAYRRLAAGEFILADGAIILSSPVLSVALPEEIRLGALRDGRLRVREPFLVRLSTEGDHTIAEAPEADEFGFGRNPSEALADLQRALAALYFSLEEEQARLGPDLQRVWDTIRRKVSRQR
jgi:hypothetical protein